MAVSEWAHFQQLFGEFQLLYCHGDPDLALFVKSAAGSDTDDIYITGPQLEIIERFSPGGWTDCQAPSGEGIMLLVGTGDSWTHLRVRRQSPDGS
jgi:hypothetical protein